MTPSNANTSGLTHPTDALRLVPIDMQIESILHDLVQEVAAAQRGARVKARARQCCARGAAKNALLNLFSAAPASPLPEGGGWLDISTAPKDGTVIDVWRDDGGRDTVFWGMPHHDCGEAGRYCDSDWHGIRAPGWVCNTFNEFVGRNHNPFTHWMPLPAAPTGGAK